MTNLFEVIFSPRVQNCIKILLLIMYDWFPFESILDLTLGSGWVNSWRGTRKQIPRCPGESHSGSGKWWFGCQPPLWVSQIHFVVLYHLSSRKLRACHMRSTAKTLVLWVCTHNSVHYSLHLETSYRRQLEDWVTAQVCTEAESSQEALHCCLWVWLLHGGEMWILESLPAYDLDLHLYVPLASSSTRVMSTPVPSPDFLSQLLASPHTQLLKSPGFLTHSAVPGMLLFSN